MKRLLALAFAGLLAATSAFAQVGVPIGPTAAPGAGGGGGSTFPPLGGTMTSNGGVLNTTQPADRNVAITTDTITSADAGRIVVYNNASGVAAAIASASSTGLTQGFSTTLNNKGAGTVTVTPTGSTINGQSSFPIPTNTGCPLRSDGTNYQIDLSACSALPLTQSVLPANTKHRVIGLTVDGGGTTPGTGVKGYYTSPFSGTITGYSLASDISGSAVFDIWKTNGAIPTVTNTITGSALPTLSSSQYLSSTTLTGWTTTVNVGDVIGFNLNSGSTLTRVTLEINVDTN